MSPPEEEGSTFLGLWDGEAVQPQVELGVSGGGEGQVWEPGVGAIWNEDHRDATRAHTWEMTADLQQCPLKARGTFTSVPLPWLASNSSGIFRSKRTPRLRESLR